MKFFISCMKGKIKHAYFFYLGYMTLPTWQQIIFSNNLGMTHKWHCNWLLQRLCSLGGFNSQFISPDAALHQKSKKDSVFWTKIAELPGPVFEILQCIKDNNLR